MIHIISPHIDDAILSIGGLMRNFIENGQQVKVEYIFTLTNWTNTEALSGAKYEEDVTLVTRLRKAEEDEVGMLLGHQYEFYDFEDLPVRTVPNDLLRKQITDRISETVTKESTCFFPVCPSHPDHGLLREIGFDFLARGFNVYFYEDLPYMTYNKNASGFYHSMHANGFEPEYIAINIDDKIALLKSYKSQVSEDWLNQVMSYSYNLTDNIFYERVWTLKTTNQPKILKTNSYVPIAMG